MQKLIVKNFGPLKEVELLINDLTILIGPNGSGKSLLAKLAFFFNEVPGLLIQTLVIRNFVSILEESPASFGEKQANRLFKKHLPALFRNLFGSKEFFRRDTEISFEWETGLTVALTCSSHFLAEFRLDSVSSGKLQSTLDSIDSSDDVTRERDILGKISTLFEPNGQRRLVRFIPENRGAFNFFDDFYLSSAYSRRTQISENPDTGYFDDQYYLEKKFWSARKNAAKVYERDWKLNIVQDVDLGTRAQSEVDALKSFHALFSEVIQGEFLVKNGAEFIQLESGELIPTDRVSSGQKEAIGAIPILFDDLMYHRTTFSVIEEPEAHLYPMTQQKIAQQLAAFFNGSNGGRLLLTTHSPYILAALDNCIQAFSIAHRSEELAANVDGILQKRFWLDINRVGASYVSSDGNLETILDLDRGSLGGEELDSDASLVSDTYEQLLELKYPVEE